MDDDAGSALVLVWVAFVGNLGVVGSLLHQGLP